MILILAQEYELNVNRVCEILDHRRAPWARLNGEDFPALADAQVRLGERERSARIRTGDGREVDLSRVRAVWARRNGQFTLPEGLSRGQREFVRNECASALLGIYSMFSDAAWMNDYFDEIRSVNKLWQLAVARDVGLRIPETLVTQDPQAAREFCGRHPDAVICKAIGQSGHVPRDEEQDGAVIYANRLRGIDDDAFESIRLAPTLLQRYTEKDIELRVTIVGARVFATAIESQRSERSREDWRRYDTDRTPYYRFDLPDEIESRLLRLMRRLNLQYGAADLILTPDGEYVFLEVNPGGQWGWIEGMTGHPIDESIADWLCHHAGLERAHA